MKKSLLFVAILSVIATLFIGCPSPTKPAVTPADDTLTGQIAAAGSVKDFEYAVIAEDAEVNKAITISNLNMGGKTLTVNVSGVTLKNLKNANVIAGAGIGNGDLIIEGSEIVDLQVLGGGANSIHFKDSTASKISVEKKDVRVALEGDSTVNLVVLVTENVKIEADAESSISTLKVTPEATDFDVDVPNIGYIESEGVETDTLVEGISLPSVADFFEAEPCASGIKITLKDTSKFSHYTENLGTINVYGSPVHIKITRDANNGYLKEYVFPFVEKDKEYIVTFSGAMVDSSNPRKQPWVAQSVKTKAGGGQDLSKYITKEQIDLYNSIKPEIEVHEDYREYYGDAFEKITTFSWGFKSDITEISQLCNYSELYEVTSDSAMILGYLDWANDSEWYGGGGFELNAEGKALAWKRDYSARYDFFEAAKTNSIDFMWGNTSITEADLAKHENQYICSFNLQFKLKEFPKYNFSLASLWSDQYTYGKDTDSYKEYTAESNKNLDLDAALKAGIANVSADGFISSQEDLFAVASEAAQEFMALGQGNPVNSRSIVSAEGTPVKTVMEATKQIVNFINSAYDEILNAENKTYDGYWNIILDRTINIGELTASQWFDTFMQVYVDFLNREDSSMNFTVAEAKELLSNQLPEEITLDQILEIADEYVSIKQLYAKANIESYITDEKIANEMGKAGVATVEALIEFGVANIQEAFKTFAGISENIPVKAVTSKIEAQIKADVDFDDIRDNMAVIGDKESFGEKDLSDLKLDSKLASAGANVVIKTAICTATGKGGIVTVEVGAGVDASKLLGIYETVMEVMATGDFTKLSALDELKTLKISVSDGTKNTWEHEYTIAEIIELATSFIGDVE